MSKTVINLKPYVDDIFNNVRKDGCHLIYTGRHSDVGRIPPRKIKQKNHALSKILYAWHHKLNILHVDNLKKKCTALLCLEPTHYCEITDFVNTSAADQNGWSEQKREYIMWRLGLWNQKETKDCIIFPGVKDDHGYGVLSVDDTTHKAHIISLRLKLGRPLKVGMQSSHLCAIRGCVNPAHLIEETPAENNRRKKVSKLQQNQVLDIVKLAQTTEKTHAEIGAQFCVSESHVGKILSGRKHSDISGLKKPYEPKKSEMIISEDMMDEICERIMLGCDEVFDPKTQETHLIPRNKPDCNGYCPTRIFGVSTYFHVLAAIIKCNRVQFPNYKNDEIVLHNCRRRDCCAFDHVKIGTKVENMQDKKRDGTNRNHATIDKEIAMLIRNASGTQIEIAKKYNVSYHVVKAIKSGDTWK